METTKNEVRGVPKSGRFWKNQKTRFKSVKKSPGLKLSFEEQLQYRNELKRVKTLSRELLQQRNVANEAKKQRRKENLQRKKENEAKSETLQVIKNPSKLKRMKKKSLHSVRKQDTTNMIQKS